MHTVAAHKTRCATSEAAAARIDRRTLGSISHHASHPEQITRRLGELEREWDVERYLETGASSFVLLGIVLSRLRSPRWLLLPGVVGGFLLQRTLQGSCAPMVLLRQLGVRMQREIDDERFALKLLRGDFRERLAEPAGSAQLFESLQR